MIERLWWLIVGHFIADFVLQTETIALNKRRVAGPHDRSKVVAAVPWYFWMTAHAMTHGLAVFFVTYSSILAVVETVLHFFIDWGKCAGYYGLKVDQALHIACKIIWAVIITGGF